MESILKNHLKENRGCYLFLFLFFFFGTAFGAHYTKSYDAAGTEYMKEFFASVKSVYESSGPDFNNIFKEAFESSAKTSLIVWVLGFTVIGVAVILAVIFKCGFMCGFLSGFLINLYGAEGFGASAIVILAKCLIYVPVLIFLSCAAMKFSMTLIKMITGKIKYRTNFKYHILRYIFLAVAVVFILVIYALFEAYVGGNMLKVYLKS